MHKFLENHPEIQQRLKRKKPWAHFNTPQGMRDYLVLVGEDHPDFVEKFYNQGHFEKCVAKFPRTALRHCPEDLSQERLNRLSIQYPRDAMYDAWIYLPERVLDIVRVRAAQYSENVSAKKMQAQMSKIFANDTV